MELILIVLASAFNLIVIRHKVDNDKKLDAVVDFGIGVMLISIGGGTLGGMVIATLTSAIISIYLWFKPFTVSDQFINKVKTFIAKTVAILLIISAIVFVAMKVL